ncbi:HNH endonuclease [Gimesia chilikensis]|uniref:HNH endonuclease n=1 Tax=Gimesia chilikensis TaxID=2605989 RepID=A0A517PYH5_9PLAN|nr:HNH endonuclease [Gimesia chilikensis]QDT24436.1 hypothetical protein HG66A1_62680 [Gimesia chilikensis]
MHEKSLYKTTKWQRVRERVYERDHGLCQLCGRPGIDTHHLRYDQGFYNEEWLILVCRRCHDIWQGVYPNHIDDENDLKPVLNRIAEISRALDGLECIYDFSGGGHKWNAHPKTL